jgi:hypothetical protein
VIRGALILAVGFSLGYSKAVRDSDEISGLLRELIDELKHFPADATATPADSESEEEVIDVEPEPAEEPTDETETDEEGESA